ncbi:hypothetical protein GQ54DRAFT_312824 [Martensiomyces pterosporus]|nr:hypothetical protein GQ54DRAFT_312824 [Martensiomyces pterosporus]
MEEPSTPTSTAAASIPSGDSANLALQSPPMALPDSPISQPVFSLTPELSGSSLFSPTKPPVSTKRTRADIATPRKPGSAEAKRQQDMEFINTPARAPPAMKRLQRAESPTEDMDSVEGSSLAEIAVYSPPKFVVAEAAAEVAQGIDAMVVDEEAATEEKTEDPPQVQQGAALAVDGSTDDQGSMLIQNPAETHVDTDNGAMETDNSNELGEHARIAGNAELNGDTHGEDNDSDIEFNTEPRPPSPPAHSGSDAAADSESTPAEGMEIAESHGEEAQVSSNTNVEPGALQSPAKADSALEPRLEREPPAEAPQAQEDEDMLVADGVVASSDSPAREDAKVSRAEMTTARILSDPELLYAASIPLPGTPAMRNQAPTTPKPQGTGAKGDGDFYIPTNWLMNPSTASKQQQRAGAAGSETPLKQYSSPAPNGESLIPVTPANQKLLDSLEIQWVSPRRAPKYSELDMEEQRREYEEKMSRQNELREMLLQALKEEYAVNMRKQELRAEQALREAEDRFKHQVAQKEQALNDALAADRARHQEEISRRDEETRIQAAELSREIDNAIAERDELRTMLDEYVAMSTKLLEQKESESNGLSRELGKLTLDRQRLQEKVDECVARAEALNGEKDEAQKRIEALMTENMRLEELSNNLRNDVMVAEERSTKIREYAEDTLSKANAEIGNLHEQVTSSRQEAAALKGQATKADARARSLQIQLDSTKRQNEELLALCERLESSIM